MHFCLPFTFFDWYILTEVTKAVIHAVTIIYLKAIIKESSVGWSTSVNILDIEQFKKVFADCSGGSRIWP